jgi:hypothetical protein
MSRHSQGRPVSTTGSAMDSSLGDEQDGDDEQDDFRARAMAMYKTRGKAQTKEAARKVKRSITKDKAAELGTGDYKSLAMKLYNMEPTTRYYRVLRDVDVRKTIDKRSEVVGQLHKFDLVKALRVVNGRGVGKELETPEGWLTTAVLGKSGSVEPVVELQADADDPAEKERQALLKKMATKAGAAASGRGGKPQGGRGRAGLRGRGGAGGRAEPEPEPETAAAAAESSSSSEEVGSDWSSDSDQDPEIRARRARDREVQAKKAEELRRRREEEAMGTGAKRLGNKLLAKGKEVLSQEADPDAPPGEMFIPTRHDAPPDPSEAGRGVEDALATKSDAEWEWQFLKKKRRRILCCCICKLHCLVTLLFIPYLVVWIVDGRCRWLGDGCLGPLCSTDYPDAFHFDAGALDGIIVPPPQHNQYFDWHCRLTEVYLPTLVYVSDIESQY